jgi:hypothetical protein
MIEDVRGRVQFIALNGRLKTVCCKLLAVSQPPRRFRLGLHRRWERLRTQQSKAHAKDSISR